MKINQFKILRFKSIDEMVIPLEEYGKGKGKSAVGFLVGLNESGKSSILEALNFFQTGFANSDYSDNYYKGAEEEKDLRVIAYLEIQLDQFRKVLVEHLKVEPEFASYVKSTFIYKIAYQEATRQGAFYSIYINTNFPFYSYVITGTGNDKKIENLKKLNKVEEEITVENAKNFLKDGQVLLTQKEFDTVASLKLKKALDDLLPKIQLWKPKPEFLINELVDLEDFKDNTSISIPLRNIFHVHGLNEDSKIKSVIEKALKKAESKAELQVGLSKSITSYINKIWKEHKINIKVHIDGVNCSVHVEDKDREHKYFNMKQRSDGFNQFISLILSLSSTNDSKKLANSIILLDEPEIHLHPSGIRYMRDEILKIGKSNQVIVSTHSHYMVDTTTPERHFIVSKKEMTSALKQVDENTSMSDDEVLASAFGLDLFKELLPQNIIVVEGGDDKAIIGHCLNVLHKDFFYAIKSAGGASKVYSIASILADEEVPAFFILDDDKDGRDEKKNILQYLKESYDKDHVFTIRDIVVTIPEKSTLEDLLPQSFVKEFFEKEMAHEFSFNNDTPILFQIKNQDESLKQNKDQLNSKKLRLSENFVERFNTKAKLEKEVPNLVALINGLVDRMRST